MRSGGEYAITPRSPRLTRLAPRTHTHGEGPLPPPPVDVPTWGLPAGAGGLREGPPRRSRPGLNYDATAEPPTTLALVSPEFFNSREDAILLWTLVILGFVLYKDLRGIAGSFLGVLRALIHRKLLLLYGRRCSTRLHSSTRRAS